MRRGASSAITASKRTALPIDAHVHLFTIARAGAILDAAAANFRLWNGRDDGPAGVLLLTQASHEEVFEPMRQQRACGGWRITPCEAEPQSLVAERDGESLLVICGRQIRCEDGLEVAALGTTSTYPDDRPLDATIAEVEASSRLAVLPWGFGKWTGRRARRIRAALERHGPESLAVGDNGGRPALTGTPGLIRHALRRGFKVLSGSDPLPCGNDFERVGSFGFLAEVSPGVVRPWQEILEWLKAEPHSPRGYGHAATPHRFLLNQVGIRMHNRRNGGAKP